MKIFPISMFFMMLSLNISASEIYQCKSPEGKVKYSEKPCVKGESQDRRDFKDIPWTTKLDANKPAGTKIIEITDADEDKIIKYACYTKIELNEFIRLAHKLSGMNVNLLKYKASKNGSLGEAVIQVTSKEDNLFKSKNP